MLAEVYSALASSLAYIVLANRMLLVFDGYKLITSVKFIWQVWKNHYCWRYKNVLRTAVRLESAARIPLFCCYAPQRRNRPLLVFFTPSSKPYAIGYAVYHRDTP